MHDLQVSGGGTSVRLTPWDERALGFRTAEITRLECEDAAAGAELLRQAEAWARSQGVHYLFGRFDARSAASKHAVLAEGFQIVESSLTLSRPHLRQLPVVPRGMKPGLRPATEDDIAALRAIARDDFAHGRFLEDPSIDPAAAASRTANWIEDLVRQGLVQTAESRGRLIGFHAERVNVSDAHADLLLTGAAAPYAMLAFPLWVAALESLAERGIGSCSTLISTANVGVINLYARLGFHFDAALFGFRKYL